MKKGKLLGMVAIPTLLLTGCIDAMPDLTNEQSEMISEYAADLLLKYSPNYNYRIVDEDVIAMAMIPEQQESEEIVQDVFTEAEDEMQTNGAIETEEAVTEESVIEETTTEISDENELNEDNQGDEIGLNIADRLGINGFNIVYNSYELCDEYPESSDGFSVAAAQDKKLLVVYFDASVIGDEAKDCNLIIEDIKVSIGINGKSVKVLNTVLPNDIVTYWDTIESNEIQSLVAIAEVSDINDENIESLVIEISNSNGKSTFNIR